MWITFMFVFWQKIKFIPPLYLETLLRYYKFVILGSLGRPGHAHQKQYYQIVEKFDVYLLAKN